MQQEEFFSDNKENNPLTSNKFPTSRPYSDINDVPVGQKSAFFIEEYAKDGYFFNFCMSFSYFF